MKEIVISMSLACAAFACQPVLAQGHQATTAASKSQKPVNAMCPIGKEPIVPSVGTIEYKGNTLGFCCPGCSKDFTAWDEAQKDEFVALAIAKREPGQEHKADGQAKPEWSEPYALATCPVSGEKLGSMGAPIVKTYNGREVRLCCKGCVKEFEADQAAFFEKIDEQIVRDQMPFYPTEVCIVSGEPLTEGGEDISNNIVYGNRLVRLCCKMCERKFKADPVKFIEKLDEASANAQRKDYPLDTCVVLGGKLGSMGEPAEMVVAGRLLRFCCAGCEGKANANPVKYIEIVDAAWNAKGMHMPAPGAHGGSHGSDH
jgi:YHS domain-containing protein